MAPAKLELRERDFESFFQTPFKIYPPEFGCVSLLKTDLARFLDAKNPLFRSDKDFSYWTALRDGKPVGRIVAHIHRASNEKYGWNRSYFGYFDCENDRETARALLTKAEEFGRGLGCGQIIGNFNLTAMQAIGVVTKIHILRSYTDQVYAPEHLASLLEENGYAKTFPMITHEVDIGALNPEQLIGPKQKAILSDPEYRFIDLKSRPLNDTLEAMRLCLNNGFVDNPMFVPLTREEMYFQAKDMMLVIDRHISSMVEHKGRPVGAIVCIPNLNPFLKAIGSRFGITTPYHFLRHKMRRESAIIIYYSVDKAYHSLGLNGAMLYRTMSALKRRGYKTMGGTWISQDNTPSLRQAEKLNAKIMHELHLFAKKT